MVGLVRKSLMFKDRRQAGHLLAQKLLKYKNQNAAVYALPRGGVVVGAEIAKELNLPLNLIIVRKIGHPNEPEYAIGAVSENGHMIVNSKEVGSIDKKLFEEEVEKQKEEAKRRRELYFSAASPQTVKQGFTAIIADDGAATGYTLRAGILELKHRQRPEKIIAALPIIPKDAADIIKKEADKLIALEIPRVFSGAVGSYYESFPQVTDEEVLEILLSKNVV